jgi:hypothetical protein
MRTDAINRFASSELCRSLQDGGKTPLTNLYLFGDVFDALIETAPIAAEVFHDPDHTR